MSSVRSTGESGAARTPSDCQLPPVLGLKRLLEVAVSAKLSQREAAAREGVDGATVADPKVEQRALGEPTPALAGSVRDFEAGTGAT